MRNPVLRFLSIFTGTGKPARTATVRGRYDAAQTTDDNRRHWSAADDKSANAAANADVRSTLRKRARYEVANNSYLNGLVRTLAHDFIGTGPRLQLGVEPFASARIVEKQFVAWMRASGLVDQLRVMHECRVRDGEAFAILATNPAIRHPVKLSLRLIEADHVTSPLGADLMTDIDGIEYDDAGNARTYSVLRNHPGSSMGYKIDYESVPADRMLHWFRVDRPGQGRGVTELQPALEPSAVLRRYTRATLTAAEFAANISGILKSDQAPGSPMVEGVEWERIEWERNALLTLPPGYSIEQLQASNPSTGYGEFKKEILNEIGRCVQAPLNVVSGNSSGYNYSSGRLDHQLYHQPIWAERERFDCQILQRIFGAWVEEAFLIRGQIPDGLPPYGEWNATFNWDGFPSPDPLKDANATTQRLAIGITTLSEECARDGKDWRDVLQQKAAEADYAAQLGVTLSQESAPREPSEEMAVNNE